MLGISSTRTQDPSPGSKLGARRAGPEEGRRRGTCSRSRRRLKGPEALEGPAPGAPRDGGHGRTRLLREGPAAGGTPGKGGRAPQPAEA